MEEARFAAIAAADEALDRVVEVQRQIDALSAERADAIRQFDDRFNAAYPPDRVLLRERARCAELAAALRLPERTAQNLAGEARMLAEKLPATLDALREGRMSYRHAQVLIAETAGLEDSDRAEVERAALQSAERLTVSKFKLKVRTLRERRRPESAAARCREAFVERRVTIEPDYDGMAYLTARLGAVEAEAIFGRLTEGAQRERNSGDSRTLEQLRLDLLVDELLDRDTTLGLDEPLLQTLGADPDEVRAAHEEAVGRFSGIRPTVIMTVPALTILGHSDEPGIIEGVGPIDPETARKLTAEAPALYRMLTDPHTGIALGLGRTSYALSDSLRRWLRVRDGSCRWPGCSVGTRRSDIDHTHDWGALGPSDHDNLAHLSRGHHTLKHHGGWRVTQPRPGHLVFTSFLGRRYETEPALVTGPPG